MTRKKPDMRGIVHGESNRRGRFDTKLGQGQQRTPAYDASKDQSRPLSYTQRIVKQSPVATIRSPEDPMKPVEDSVVIDDRDLALLSWAHTKLTGDRLAKYLQSKFCRSSCSWFSNYRNGLVMSGYFCQCGKLETIT